MMRVALVLCVAVAVGVLGAGRAANAAAARAPALRGATVGKLSLGHPKPRPASDAAHLLIHNQPDPAVVRGTVNMNLTLFQNASKHNAFCNDGTPSGYYIRRSTTSSRSWIVYLEGGGLCYDYESCHTRAPELTSSTPWPKTLGAAGIFAEEPSNQFSDFNKIIVIYCTSDLYTGTKAKGGLLGFSFYGANIVPALLDELSADFASADQLLLTGGSAGGIGTFMNYPLVKSQLSHITVKALPDAGWFLTTMAPYSSKALPLPKMLEEGMSLWDGRPPAACMAALGQKAYLCYSGPYVYNFMPAPPTDMFVQKAQMDAWTLGHDGVKAPYTAAEIEWMVELAAEVRATFTLDKVPNVFSANCIYHTSIQLLWDTVRIANTTLGQAVQQWYFGGKQVALVDSCATPLCNPTCV